MPVTQFATPEKYSYLNGFGSYHECVSPAPYKNLN